MKIKNKYFDISILLMPVVLAVICLFTVLHNNSQATLPIPMPLDFIGEYSYDGENWQTLMEDEKFSALKGDLYLRGHFSETVSEDAAINFYKNHIGVEIYVNGERAYIDIIAEVSSWNLDISPSMCGKTWVEALSREVTENDYIEIKLSNPHKYGNDSAYNDFLDTLCVSSGGFGLLTENLKSYGYPFRFFGGLLVIMAMVLLGAAISAAVMQVSASKSIFKMGLITLFASGFIVFDAIDAFFWSNTPVLNTYASQLSMMLAVHCFGCLFLEFFTGKRYKIAKVLVEVSAILNILLILLSVTGLVLIFDTGYYWAIFQFVFCATMIVMCVDEHAYNSGGNQLMLVSAAVIFFSVIMDILGVGRSIVTGAICSKATLGILVVVHIIVAGKQIIDNHQASILAEKLKRELEESRISIMLSQIQPHFLYNSISAIQALCSRQPMRAKDALGEFALYLRGNINSLSSSEPIPFSKELQHVESYLALEKMRFEDDLNIVYDIQETDFSIPALTLQPLVENAVKHGVFAREDGGTVTIKTYAEDEKIIIAVIDDGIGFDTENIEADDRIHVGIKNVKSRLEKMVYGDMVIESVVGKGTTAKIILDR